VAREVLWEGGVMGVSVSIGRVYVHALLDPLFDGYD
jgi:hypothetical protein